MGSEATSSRHTGSTRASTRTMEIDIKIEIEIDVTTKQQGKLSTNKETTTPPMDHHGNKTTGDKRWYGLQVTPQLCSSCETTSLRYFDGGMVATGDGSCQHLYTPPPPPEKSDTISYIPAGMEKDSDDEFQDNNDINW